MNHPLLATLSITASAYAQGGDPAVPWLRIILAFLFCIAVAVGAILWLRARNGLSVDLKSLTQPLIAPRSAAARREMAIEERLRLSPASQMILLRCGTRRYLVHIGPQGAQKIDRLDDVDDGETDGTSEAGA